MLPPVRLASVVDEPQLMGLCRLLHADNGKWVLNETKVRAMLQRAFDRDLAMIGVIEVEQQLAGFLYLTVETSWYSDQSYLAELFNFVHPDYRQLPVSHDLIEWAKACSDRLKVPLMIGILSNHRTEAKVRFYRRQLQPAGAFFIHNAHLGGGETAIAV